MARKKWSETKVNLSSAVLGGAVALIIGLLVGFGGNSLFSNFLPYLGFKKEATQDWSELNEVYSKLKENYDGEVSSSQTIDGAKRGIVDSVGDIYTTYMDMDEAKDFEKTLHGDIGAGIGVEMGLRDGYVRVLRTLPDNPARKAGILAGDILYKVDDEEVWSLKSEEVSNKIRGEAGTEVKVIVIRDGKEKEFKMKREKINNVSADVEYDKTTAIIRISRFDNDTGSIVEKMTKDFAAKDVKKVILDLRGNGGGYVSAARDLLSLWIDGEKILAQKSIHFEDEITYANHNKAVLSNMKTIILTNESTASAAEITAGALKDYKKATIVGEKTFGKGVVQTMLDLSGGAMLKVTTARWYTPNDNSIDKKGIEPDIKVENSYDDTNAGRDPQLEKAKAL